MVKNQPRRLQSVVSPLRNIPNTQQSAVSQAELWRRLHVSSRVSSERVPARPHKTIA